MDKRLLRKFISQINNLEGKEYLLSTVAYGSAPTLSGLKPSSLISFGKQGRNLYQLWEEYKDDICASLGIHFYELKLTKERRLILFYNSQMLEEHITSKQNRSFLKRMGYEDKVNLNQSLEFLKQRFKLMCPHEIGVFLGIPIEDVCGFIENKGSNFLFCKYWKVYHNLEETKNLFDCYDRARARAIYEMMDLEPYEDLAI